MTFVVDDKTVDDPDEAAIVRGFGSITPGLSLVILARDKKNSLTTSGTPVEGWGALLYETDGITSSANPSQPLSQEKIIGIFLAYARGDHSWEKEFEWNVIDGKWSAKRIVILAAILVAALYLARSCSK